MSRKDAILHAAADHFGRFGFRGASLRDIARDAAVSLTLLNHHFGSKSDLLAAVVANHRPQLSERAEGLRRVTRGGGFQVRALVEAWVRIAFDNAATPDGLRFVRLAARILGETSEDASNDRVRAELEATAQPLVEGLQQQFPDASPRAIEAAAATARGAMLATLLGARRTTREGVEGESVDATPAERAQLSQFLVAGLEAALEGAIADSAVAAQDMATA